MNTTHKNIDRNVESMWQAYAFKTAMQNTIDKRVPSKLTQGRHTHPWIYTTIRRRIGQETRRVPPKPNKDGTKPVKSAAYTAIVRPIVEYASTVRDPSNQQKIKSIEQVQKRAAQLVHNNYTDRTPRCVTNMVKSLKWENLEDRRKSVRLSMLFKIQHDLIDIDR